MVHEHDLRVRHVLRGLVGTRAPGSRAPRRTADLELRGDGCSPTQGSSPGTYAGVRPARELLYLSAMILNLCWVRWDNGAAIAYLTPAGRCNWSYCGGGPSFRDVAPTHFVAAIESLLGWDHPAARQANDFARSAS